jgi:predicted dehydrogenase
MYSPNDNVQIALIGAGGMGQGDARLATSLPGVKLIAAADCYDGRLAHMKEVYGKDTFTARNYQDIVARKDVDAVIIGTPDHWHSRISIDCLNAGKHVYCEKPMVHAIEEGKTVIDAQQHSGKVFQVGSQYRSSVMYLKAHELYKSGAIGKLNMVEAWLDRNTAIGAWQYTIPPDANTTTCDWTQFQGSAPKHAWDPKRFFRWRNYRDYGTGVAGDLFVHLITGLHTVTESIGPNRIYATGGLRYWKDGRDVPDVMLATMDYPETATNPAFNFVLRVNFKSGVDESFGVKFIGSDGTMTVSFTDLELEQVPRPDQFDYTITSFSNDMQKRLKEVWEEKHPPVSVSTLSPNGVKKFNAEGSSPHLDHHKNFYRSIREGAPLIEDATFGLRAAGPALLTNQSLFENKIMGWNPETMTIA